MSTLIQYPHLSVDADGTARIGATRYKVIHLAAEHYQYGWTAEELLRQHPDLKPEQVYAALVYFYDHRNELIAQLEATAEAAEERRNQKALSREELLKRKAATQGA